MLDGILIDLILGLADLCQSIGILGRKRIAQAVDEELGGVRLGLRLLFLIRLLKFDLLHILGEGLIEGIVDFL